MSDIYDRYQDVCDRMNETRAWARNRVACCNAVLNGRAGDVSTHDAIRRHQERDTLEAVLRILDGKPTP